MSRPHTKRSPKGESKKPSASAISRSSERERFAGVNPKLAKLLRQHFTRKGRAARIARAAEAWRVIEEVGSTFKKLDPDTIKWIAEDPDLEYL